MTLKKLTATFLCIIGICVAACSQSPEATQPTPSATNSVEVTGFEDGKTEEKEITEIKTFGQCESSSPLNTQLTLSQSSSSQVEKQVIFKTMVAGEAGISVAVTAKLQAELEAHIKSTDTNTQAREEKASIEVPAFSKKEYQIVWKEIRRSGLIKYSENGQSKSVGYSYRVGFALVSTDAKDIPCPSSTKQIISTPLVVTTIVKETVPPIVETIVVRETVEITKIVEVTPEVRASSVTPQSSPQVTSATPSSFLTFEENFSDNSKGWGLTGSRRISQGQLAVSVKRAESIETVIPQVQVGTNFYVETDMKLTEGHGCGGYAGIGIGKKDGSKASFLVFGQCSGDRVAFYENGKELFSTQYDASFSGRATLKVGVEAKDGLCTLYINGNQVETAQIKQDGGNVSLIAAAYDYWTADNGETIVFDNISIRESR